MPNAPASDTEYECALSGRTARETDLIQDDPADEAELDELPIGWLKITVQRRGINPDWLKVQRSKERQLAGMLAGIPDDASDEEKVARAEDAEVLVASAFVAIEAVTPKYAVIEDSAIVADPDQDKALGKEWSAIATALGLDVSGGA